MVLENEREWAVLVREGLRRSLKSEGVRSEMRSAAIEAKGIVRAVLLGFGCEVENGEGCDNMHQEDLHCIYIQMLSQRGAANSDCLAV